MGNEVSAPHEGSTEVLENRDIPSIAKYMKSKECRKIFVMLGAGVSTAAGIPDFRSPGTGLYSNLQRLNLPYPEAVFEINYFRENPLPFYILASELYPGKYRPTFTHTFVKLLADHSYLDTCFTQNIDTLERQANVPGHRIVEAHGSFADQHCIDCHQRFDSAKMKAAVAKAEIVRCADCDGLVKPDIVFFGESLPPLFQQTVPKLRNADLLFVIGTSLKVHPFASLTELVPESCPRVLINMEPAGDIGSRPDDVVLLGRCDEVIRDLARELGWEEELDREWGKTEILVPLDSLARAEAEEKVKAEKAAAERSEEAAVHDPAAANASEDAASTSVSKTEVEERRVKDEVEALAEQIDKAFALSDSADGPVAIKVETITPDAPTAVPAAQPELVSDGQLRDKASNQNTAESDKEKEKL